MTRMVQKYVVCLRSSGDRQIWLAYDNCGRIGNANYHQAFQYDSYNEARVAIKQLPHRWTEAQILGTLVEVTE